MRWVLFWFITTPALAEGKLYISHLGDGYFLETVENGLVLRSEHEKHYFVEDASGFRFETGTERFLFHADCSVKSDYWGDGSFFQADSGFMLTFDADASEFWFPRQTLPAPLDTACLPD
jgi:hypothetical protein